MRIWLKKNTKYKTYLKYNLWIHSNLKKLEKIKISSKYINGFQHVINL